MNQWNLIFGVVPALILFLFGIENFSTEIQHLVGKKFKRLISRLTKSPVRGAFLGAIVTAIVQSSTATTVITVSLVNAGIISFSQSLGIIFGSNIGTTITAQLVAFKITKFAPIFIIVGFLLKFLGGRYKLLSKPLFFFGLVFYGLMLVNNSIDPLKTDPNVLLVLARFDNVPFAILAGFVFTTIVQSSSVTSGLIVVLAQNGMISLSQGIPLLLGANIGTSTTAFMASLGLNLHARRVGMANFLFNVLGVILAIPFIGLLEKLIILIGGPVSMQIANAHVIFNVTATIVFLLGVTKFTKIVESMVPGDEKEILYTTKYLKEELPKNSQKALKLIKKEVAYSIEITKMIFDISFKLMKNPKKVLFMKLEKLETLNDYLDDRITDALLKISSRKLTRTEGKKIVILVQVSNVIEQLGDLGEDLGDISRYLFERGKIMDYESVEAVDKVLRNFRKNLDTLRDGFPYIDRKLHSVLKGREEEILDLINDRYESHLSRLSDEYSDDDYHGSTFVETISVMESSLSKIREIRKLGEKYADITK